MPKELTPKSVIRDVQAFINDRAKETQDYLPRFLFGDYIDALVNGKPLTDKETRILAVRDHSIRYIRAFNNILPEDFRLFPGMNIDLHPNAFHIRTEYDALTTQMNITERMHNRKQGQTIRDNPLYAVEFAASELISLYKPPVKNYVFRPQVLTSTEMSRSINMIQIKILKADKFLGQAIGTTDEILEDQLTHRSHQ